MGQVELIWAAFFLMILGAFISMCMKCQQTGSKQEKANVDNQRTQCENQQDCERPLFKFRVKTVTDERDIPYTRTKQNRKLSSFNDFETCNKSRFQNVTTEIQTEDDSTLGEPISSHLYHNWQKDTGLSSDDDSHGYQNVIGTIKSNRLLTDENIYENNLAIQIWKQAQISESDSTNSKEESIYINTEQYSSSQGRDAHL